MKPRSFTANVLSVIGNRGALAAAAFVSSVAVSRATGSTGLGLYSVGVASVAMATSLGDLGIRQALARRSARDAEDGRSAIDGVAVACILGAMSSGLLALLSLWQADVVSRAPWATVAFVVSAAIKVVGAAGRGVSLGRGDIRSVNNVDLIEFGLVPVPLLVLWSIGALTVNLAAAAFAVCTGAAALYGAKLVGAWRLSLDGPTVAAARSLLAIGFGFAFVLFLASASYRLDLIIVQRLLGSAGAGEYAAAVRIAETIWQVPAAVGLVLFSASTRASSRYEAVSRTLVSVRSVLALVAVAAALLAVAAAVLIPRLFGPGFESSVAALRILLPGAVSAVVFKLVYMDVSAGESPMRLWWLFATLIALNVVLDFALIPILGVVGAAVASSLSYFACACIAARWYVVKYDRRASELLVPKVSDFKRLGLLVRSLSSGAR